MEQPLRAELFSMEQMAEYAKGLAQRHEHEIIRSPDRLLPRLYENEKLLLETYQLLQVEAVKNNPLLPAEEWFLDNFYIIEEQILISRKHLPKSYSRELPSLKTGKTKGFPRVYAMALKVISHGDGRVDEVGLSAFVDAYQTTVTLTLGELWAIPIMLRLALIENLRRVATRIAASKLDRKLGDYWADRMTTVSEKDPKNLIIEISDMARSSPPMSSAFVAALARRLQGQSLALPMTWIEQRLTEFGFNVEQMVHMENQRQAEDQVSVSNSIASLRFLTAIDWRGFVEALSKVEQTLSFDPMGVYSRSDFATRDRCRHRVELLAKRCSLPEKDIAARALDLAQQSVAVNGLDNRMSHVGYYLLDHGIVQLEQLVKPKFTIREQLERFICRFPLFLYLSSIGLFTLLFMGIILLNIHHIPGLPLCLTGILVLIGASQPAVNLVNWLTARLINPGGLARMDYSKGIPPEARTLVVVPCMLSSPENISSLLENLEVLYLANRDNLLHFGLVTDFQDAPQEQLSEDNNLFEAAKTRIEDLNARYPQDQAEKFYLFHRPRQWNPQENCWMGRERKRGKLENLNIIICGGMPEPGTVIVGDTSILELVKYVITLDTDTQLTLDSARTLVATMNHPLNRPQYDDESKSVCAGYGILQPRMENSMNAVSKSWLVKLFGGQVGIDPYTLAVSDVYQDLFREGSFVGKGIYDVDVIHKVLTKRFPVNRVLSHDLLEGGYVRSGLVSDVVLYEHYPSHYLADAQRRHRWIRGDWQIARWLCARVPGLDGTIKNPLGSIYRWKIFDNLRRSLIAPALITLLAIAWLMPLSAGLFTFLFLAMFFLPPCLFAVVAVLFQKPQELLFLIHVRYIFQDLYRNLARSMIRLALLPYEAYYCLDAIIRTWFRLWITHKNLLIWCPSNNSSHNSMGLAHVWKSMGMLSALSFGVGLIILGKPEIQLAPLALIVLWFFSPLLVWFISSPQVVHINNILPEQTLFLHKLARRTWQFFDSFVNEEDNWLPVDNVQEKPLSSKAHRTSPTNIGMYLLANLTAYDFGYISTEKLLSRVTRTIHTMENMERFRGHFYNWYDTQTLQPLGPLYVSSVDSGNLSGHLLVLRQGLLAMPDHPVAGVRIAEGWLDTYAIFEETMGNSGHKYSLKAADNLKKLFQQLEVIPAGLGDRLNQLHLLQTLSTELCAGLSEFPEAFFWMDSLKQQFRDHQEDIRFMAPWLSLPLPDEEFWKDENEVAAQSLDRIKAIWEMLNNTPTLRDIAGLGSQVLPLIAQLVSIQGQEKQDTWLSQFQKSTVDAVNRAMARIAALEKQAQLCSSLVEMEYDFLYDSSRHLLAIGYNVSEHRRDEGYYDLLASEARLGSYVAIAQGYIPQENWFSLGRQLTISGRFPVLLSWGGSMFEYLMPLLVMPTYKNTLLDQTFYAVVSRQIEYGNERGVLWGISESGYNITDANLQYQYRAFGIPGLGFKRGLSDDLVITPYASALALMVKPDAATENLQRLAKSGLQGRYGLYEAVDFTPARLSSGQKFAVVSSYMAHHQGMVLLSLSYFLLGRPMQKRFHSEPRFLAADLLLQERVPKVTPAYPHAFEVTERPWQTMERQSLLRIYNTPNTPFPEVHLLSNGRYQLMVTQAGGGYSRWKDFALTRFREDATLDNTGLFCYIRDVERNESWSAAYQPVCKSAKNYEAIFSQARAEFRRRDQELDTHTEIVVSPEDDIEMRRIRITNYSRKPRVLDVTSYAEVVLAPAAAEITHPAFNNLFVQTEILPNKNSILCSRRPRSAEESPPWMFCLMVIHGATVSEISYETDRLKFIGRGRSVADPVALENRQLTNSEGAVLDPVVAIRSRITIEPEGTAVVNIVLGAAETREIALGLIEKYNDWRLSDRVFELAFSHGQVLLHQMNATEADAQLYARLASSVIFPSPSSRAQQSIILKNKRGQSGLWGYGISGDLPIVLLRISDSANIDLVRRMVQAHAYWRRNGLAVDLVIWNEDPSGYRQQLQEKIMGLIASSLEAHIVDRPAGIFIRKTDQIPDEDQILMQTVARIILTDWLGPIEDQIIRRGQAEFSMPTFTTSRLRRLLPEKTANLIHRDLLFFNGIGGFTHDGKEYILTTSPNQMTPMPWSNVLANPYFGSVISESGSAYTFSENAHEFRITPWNNDPVCDSGGEAFYLRDEETGRFWSPAPFPARGIKPYTTRHGFGYSIFEYTDFGITSELTTYVAIDAPVKFCVLKVSNISGRNRRLSATGFVTWVLGELRHKTLMHVVTEIDPKCNAMFAHNPYNLEFSGRVAFIDMNGTNRYVTGDRTEFIGRNKSLKNPSAMGRSRLSNKVGAALDPCGAVQTMFDLTDGQEHEIVFILGAGHNIDEARSLVQRFRGAGPAIAALKAVGEFWDRSLGAVHVDTPDLSLNILANGWLLYQTIACRLWARSGYYQSGGAFGFRDQLQDTLALLHNEPQMLREQILLCAKHQFREGDVQHWWHPPQGRGVRTRCSDDYLWLPFAVSRYISGTGDTGVLEEMVEFIEGRLVSMEEDAYYDLPQRSEEKSSLYDHCARAILLGLRYGVHGLPLMGTGDWNDGMNLVGEKGQGESVWLAFFLYDILISFSEIAKGKKDTNFAQQCNTEAKRLKKNINTHTWNGSWWLRAFFDNGDTLGSIANNECCIDLLPQSWAVLSQAGDSERQATAMQSVDEYLVKHQSGLIQLFDPPFDKSTNDPGYIKGYVPGVRENGGQYSHAAVWAVMAMASVGESQKAWDWFSLINPINHSSTSEQIEIYKTEPYVMVGDIYSQSPHVGRGGWSWYTGSAGWMYQLILESLLGLKLEVDKLTFAPCWKKDWDTFHIHYRYRETVYHITVERLREGNPVKKVILDDVAQPCFFLPLIDDQMEHRAIVVVGED
ncbi:MAG TPA: cyclic beta 1-2 glucan synthetase [Candidatus Margulisbacteria bacterium]|nr:cyclic beta 1-2 glucan synthetase [Candidatus Margulisiibacteriota bacterium]